MKGFVFGYICVNCDVNNPKINGTIRYEADKGLNITRPNW